MIAGWGAVGCQLQSNVKIYHDKRVTSSGIMVRGVVRYGAMCVCGPAPVRECVESTGGPVHEA